MIDRATRIPLFIVFSIVSAVGLLIFALTIWRSKTEERREPLIDTENENKTTTPNILAILKVAFRLLKTRNMLLLLIPFGYTGN